MYYNKPIRQGINVNIETDKLSTFNFDKFISFYINIYNIQIQNDIYFVWFLSPTTTCYTCVLASYGDVGISSGILANPDVNRNHGTARPVLYLSSSVKTTSGDGSIDSPYKLSL